MSTNREYNSAKDIAAFAVVDGIVKLGIGSFYTTQERCAPNDTETVYHYQFKPSDSDKSIDVRWYPSKAEAVDSYNKNIEDCINANGLEVDKLQKKIHRLHSDTEELLRKKL